MNIIVNIPQIEFDDFEMKPDNWLELTKDDTRPKLSISHGNLSTDGISMHVIGKDHVCRCANKDVHEKINNIIDAANKSRFVFSLNRTFLINALAGINPSNDEIQFFCARDDGTGIVTIQDKDHNRQAIIMSMSNLEKPYIKIGLIEERED